MKRPNNELEKLIQSDQTRALQEARCLNSAWLEGRRLREAAVINPLAAAEYLDLKLITEPDGRVRRNKRGVVTGYVIEGFYVYDNGLSNAIATHVGKELKLCRSDR